MPQPIDRFVGQRAAGWERLAHLVRRGRSGVRRMPPEEVLELGRLYRAAASDLAIAQRDYPEDRTAFALNTLVAEAHALVYSGGGVSWRVLRDFVRRGYPRLVRANGAYVAVAFVLFAAPAVAGYLLGLAYPAILDTTLPQQMRRALEQRHLWTNIESQVRPLAASAIMTNNIQVAFIAFAGGILAGTLTVYALIQNGLFFGSILAATQQVGLAPDLLTFVVGHGVIELSVIFLAGGAGLRMASALLNPGDLARKDALRIRGAQAVRMVLGCIPMLVVAGCLEAFLSPTHALWGVKVAAGLAGGGALWGYLLFGGRKPTPAVKSLTAAPAA
jgi:uncharacterized membrane protein SpoIIM required for sporulation